MPISLNFQTKKALFFICTILLVLSTSSQGKVTTSTVQYMSGKDTIQAILCVPTTAGKTGGTNLFPAIILIHEWWGLNSWIKQNAESLAARGYVTLAIDLYRGKVAESADDAHQLMRGLPEDRAVRDLKAAVGFLQARADVNPKKIGSIGWCMGGGYSLAAAFNIPQLASGVICYGRLVTDSSSIQQISCPLLGIFGEEDKGITPASVKEFESTCKSFGKSVDVTIYEKAGHAFMNPNNKDGYRDNSAKDAWKKINTFFDKTLQH